MEKSTKDIEARLREAIDGGEVLNIIYRGGSQPGTLREIAPISIKGDKVSARCLSTWTVKTFCTYKIVIVDDDENTDILEWRTTPQTLSPLTRHICALGIKGIGERRAVVLAERFKTMDALMRADFEDLYDLYTIGPSIAISIVEFFRGRHTALEESIKAGLRKPPLPLPATEGPLKRLTFLFTGILEEFSREEAKRLVLSAGGNIASSVNTRVDYLVAGKKTGSKYKKAQDVGVKIISEEQFIAMIKEDPTAD